MDALRILHIAAGKLFGGLETLLLTLVRHRATCPEMEQRFAVCFEGRLSRELQAHGVEVDVLGAVRLSRPWTVWQARRRLAAYLRRRPVDVVVCHSAWPLAVLGPAVHRGPTPLALWVHDAGKQHWLDRWARRTVPDLIICNSRFTAGTLQDCYPGVPREVVYCPVAAPGVRTSSATRERLRADLNTPSDTVVILQLGRLEECKGHRHHLEALRELRQREGWECWIVGGAQRPHEVHYLRQLRETATRDGLAAKVRFFGQHDDVRRLFEAADIFCQPNTAPDAFGITFVEAMYEGLPVVTTGMGGALEVLDANCAVIVRPGDVAALSAALGRLLDDPGLRKRLGAAGPARARALCDPAARMKEMSQVLTRLTPVEA